MATTAPGHCHGFTIWMDRYSRAELRMAAAERGVAPSDYCRLVVMEALQRRAMAKRHAIEKGDSR